MGISFNALLERFTWNALAVAVFVAPLAIGGVHWPVQMVLAVVSCTILVAYALLQFRRGRRIRYDGFVIVGVAAGAAMLLQLLPIGESLLATLSPAAAAGVARAREFGFEVPTRLSVAPVATASVLIIAVSALAVYVTSFNLAFRDDEGSKLLAIVGISGAVIAAVVLAHAAGHAGAILWFHTPKQGFPEQARFFSTFVSNSHGAAFLNLSFFVLIGVWRKARFGKTKGIYGFLVLLTGVASVMMASRAGLLALLAGVGLLAVTSRWSGARRRTQPSPATMLLGVVASLICVALFLVAFSLVVKYTGSAAPDLFVPEGDKITVWQQSVKVVREFGHVGAGAGAFEAAFAPFNDFSPMASFAHASNELLELLVEFGLPLGITFVLAVIVLLLRRFHFAKSEDYFAEAACGVFAVCVHNLADFNVRIPGVLLPLAVTLGAIGGAYARNVIKHREWGLAISGGRLLPLAIVAFLLVIAGGGWTLQNGLDHSDEALRALAAQPSSQAPEAEEEQLGRVLAHHPRDGQVYALLGMRSLAREDEEGARRLFAAARELCPACLSYRTGVLRLYLNNGETDKALAMFMELLKAAPEGRATVFEAVERTGIPEERIAEAWAEDAHMLCEYAAHLWRANLPGRQERLLLAAMRETGHNGRMLAQLGNLYLTVDAFDRADDVATLLMAFFPGRQEGYQIQAMVFIHQGALEEALLMYEEGRKRITGKKLAVSLGMLRLMAQMRQWDRFESLAAEVRNAIGDDDKSRSMYHQIIALREEMLGRHFAALRELEQAEEVTPFDVRIALKKAELQIRLGHRDRAAAEYRKVLRISPDSTDAAERLRNLETSRP